MLYLYTADYFAILTDYGLPGLLGYLFFIVLSIGKVWKNMIIAQNIKLKAFYQFGLITLISLAIFGIAAEDFVSPIYWFLLAISTKTI